MNAQGNDSKQRTGKYMEVISRDLTFGTIRHLPGGTEEDSKVGWSVCQPKFEPSTPKIQLRNVTSLFSLPSDVT